MKAIGYYVRNKGGRREKLAISFLEGIKNRGYKYETIKASKKIKVIDCNLMVAIGWRPETRLIAEAYKKKGIPVLCIFEPQIRPDGVFHRYLDNYWGICWNGPHKGYFYEDNLPNNRWRALKERYKIEILPWRKKGDHVLIAYKGEIDFDGNSRRDYYDKLIDKVNKITKREIVICFRNEEEKNKLEKKKVLKKYEKMGCKFIINMSNGIKDAYCLLASGGTTVSKAIFHGIPTYWEEKNITDPLRQARTIEEFLDKPSMPDRENWCNWIGYQQWKTEEMLRDLCFDYYQRIKKYIKE